MAEERVKRKLAAIVSADVVGWSRLMGEDEAGTLATLKRHREELIDPKIAEYGGRIVSTAGDSVLVEYPSAVDAVMCSVEIQHAMVARNADLSDDKKMMFRVGVNLGEVIIEGDDVFGDGVNVAARLQEGCEPGGIAVSGEVHRLVRGKAGTAFDDAGEQPLKNIAEPVRVFRAILDGKPPPTVEAVDMNKNRAGFGGRPAIAVLPFVNMSGDPEQEYFADGITEDIITALTRWRSFPVIARNSCFAYKDKTVDIKQAGRELGARYLLEGSVRKRGPRVRVTAQLIDGTRGHHVWAESYDRELNDIFEVQDEIVQRIAALVAPELDKAELNLSMNKRVEDLDAWDLCLRAKPLVRKRTRESNARARELFSRAISIRPNYGDAYAGLAMSHSTDILIGVAEDRAATATLAMEAAQKAIECDETSAWAHHELSTAYQWLNRLEDALDEARIAVNLNPNDAYALHALGNKSDLAGNPDGIAFMEKAQKLNPEDARLPSHLTFLARAYVNVGNLDAAVERARHAIRRRPDYAPAYYILAIALGYRGELDQARAALAKCDELSPGFVQSRQRWCPYVDAASNNRLQEGLRRIAR